MRVQSIIDDLRDEIARRVADDSKQEDTEEENQEDE